MEVRRRRGLHKPPATSGHDDLTTAVGMLCLRAPLFDDDGGQALKDLSSEIQFMRGGDNQHRLTPAFRLPGECP